MPKEKDCIFCKIVKGEIPSYKIYEDDFSIVFLDAFPSMKGQTLVIPKKHLEPTMFDLNDEDYTKLLLTAKKIAKAMKKALNSFKIGLIIEGLELDHVHIKLYPLTESGFSLKHLDPKPPDSEMKEIAEKIRKALD